MSVTNNASPSSINTLPEELLLAIFSYLEVRRGFLGPEHLEKQRKDDNQITIRTLHAVTLTCRRFAAIATPLLYTCVIHNVHLTEKHTLSVLLLLRTFSENPILRCHVQYLEFEMGWNSDLLPAGEEIRSISKDISLNDLFNSVRKLHFHPQFGSVYKTFNICNDEDRLRVREYELSQYTRSGNTLEKAIFTLLMTSENLSEVAFDKPATHLEFYIATKKYSKRGLQAIWCKEWGSNVTIYTLKAMRERGSSLQLYAASEIFASDIRAFQLGAFQLGELVLDYPKCDFFYYMVQLRQCSALRNFTCRWYDDTTPIWKGFDFKEIKDTLELVRTSLETLTLDVSALNFELCPENTPATRLGSLQALMSLKRLSVCRFFLCANEGTADLNFCEILPESLDSLEIRSPWDPDLEQAFGGLISDSKSVLPHLKRVECSSRPENNEEWIGSFQRIGVELVLPA